MDTIQIIWLAFFILFFSSKVSTYEQNKQSDFLDVSKYMDFAFVKFVD